MLHDPNTRTDYAPLLPVGFHEAEYDEAGYAGAIARHLNAEHHTLYVMPEHATELIPRLPEMYDEPNADISQIPAFFLSKLARQHVAVAFTGDAAAEPFGGGGLFYRAADHGRPVCRHAALPSPPLPKAFAKVRCRLAKRPLQRCSAKETLDD